MMQRDVRARRALILMSAVATASLGALPAHADRKTPAPIVTSPPPTAFAMPSHRWASSSPMAQTGQRGRRVN